MTNIELYESGADGLYIFPNDSSLLEISNAIDKGRQILEVVAALGDYDHDTVRAMLDQEFPLRVPLEDVVVTFSRHYSRAPDMGELKKTLDAAKSLLLENNMEAEYILI